jgi:hypothetical protein
MPYDSAFSSGVSGLGTFVWKNRQGKKLLNYNDVREGSQEFGRFGRSTPPADQIQDRALATKELYSGQNGKKFSRRGAELAEKSLEQFLD